MYDEYNIINKVVKVKDMYNNIDYSSLLYYMYPNYKPKTEIFFDKKHDILYTGKYSTDMKEKLQKGTKSFIAISDIGIYDIDMTIRENLLKILYNKWNREIKEKTKNNIENMTESDFISYFKKYWVIGKSKIETSDISIWDLYKVLGKNRHDILVVYYKLTEYYSNATIFNSTVSFLEKAIDKDMITTQSGAYIKLINNFSNEYKNKIPKILSEVYKLKGNTEEDKKYKTLFLLMKLGKGDML